LHAGAALAKLSTLRAISSATSVSIYLTMVLGSYVSQIGAGLACPGWPVCPPLTSWPVLVEFVHRGLAMLALVFGLVTWLALARHGRSELKAARLLSSLGFLMLVVQVFLVGAQVIFTSLQPLVVTVHMAVALLVFALYTGATITLVLVRIPSEAETLKNR